MVATTRGNGPFNPVIDTGDTRFASNKSFPNEQDAAKHANTVILEFEELTVKFLKEKGFVEE